MQRNDAGAIGVGAGVGAGAGVAGQGLVKYAPNVWSLVKNGLGKLMGVGPVAIGGAAIGGASAYTGSQVADAVDIERKFALSNRTGLDADVGADGKPDFTEPLRRAYANPGKSAMFGPVNPNLSRRADGTSESAEAYADFMRFQHNNPKPEMVDPAAAITEAAKQGAGGGGSGESPFTPKAIKFVDGKPYALLSDEQRQKLLEFQKLDGSGMDADLEKLRAGYSQREAGQNQQIKDIEDRPYQVDLSPVMALWKSWYGSDFGNYKRPETVDARMQRVYDMRDKMQQEATQRDAALFNAKSTLEGRKLDVSKYNNDQSIDSVKRAAGLNKDEIEMGNKIADSKNDNAYRQGIYQLQQQAQFNTDRHQRALEKISGMKAASGGGGKDKILDLLDPVLKDTIKKTVDDISKGDPNVAALVLKDISNIVVEQAATGATDPARMESAIQMVRQRQYKQGTPQK